ncbi:MAG TPA: sigma-54 dependent transcriptional regulator [Thermoanaerobaculia bacterium]|nr:sigma-54 dependent transcriptional regulator [Thermoanaerobaculia bacterium]
MSAILLVDDEAPFRTVLREILEPLGHRLLEAASAEEALERLSRMRIDLVIADQRMPGLDGLTLLRRIRSMPAPPAVVLLTAYGSIPAAVDAVRAGAIDYLTKPLQSPEELIAVVDRAMAADDDEIAGESAPLREVIQTADRVAEKDVPVLITGESGTGKELVARRIHRRSRRAKKAFVAVNCAALPETLAESELFGHERGAFTGADRQRAGRFEEADGGTLFLDEVGELSPAVQAKLLRAIEEHVIRRVGGTRDIEVDIRVLAATNRDLTGGGFRPDLYFRIAVVRLQIPPLRQRVEDVEPIAKYLLARLATKHGLAVPALTSEAVQALRRHPWPGNVRELRNVLERALVLRGSEAIRGGDLALTPAAPTLAMSHDEVEKERVLEALRQAHGNRENAARLLGISVRTLYYRLNRLGLA